MADTQTDQQNRQQSEQGEKQYVDSTFFEQMGGPVGASSASLGFDATSQIVQSYFDQVEATTRQARRMADLWAQSLILQQTASQIAQVVVPQVTRQVVQHLQRNPDLLKQAIRQ